MTTDLSPAALKSADPLAPAPGTAPLLAGLPMYDWPQAGPAHDRFWAAIARGLRAEGIAAPDTLARGLPLFALWEDPGLLLGQTCGLPYRTLLHGRVTLVGTPDYGLPGAPPGHYCSEIVVRADSHGGFADFLEGTLAFNGHDSQSGWGAAQNHAAETGATFTRTLHTGAHRESLRAVAEGRADIATVDAVTWRLFCRFLPEDARPLRSLGQTRPTPGLPLITALGRDPAPLARAVESAIAGLSDADRADLGGIRGLARVPAGAYLAVPTPPPPSQDAPAA